MPPKGLKFTVPNCLCKHGMRHQASYGARHCGFAHSLYAVELSPDHRVYLPDQSGTGFGAARVNLFIGQHVSAAQFLRISSYGLNAKDMAWHGTLVLRNSTICMLF